MPMQSTAHLQSHGPASTRPCHRTEGLPSQTTGGLMAGAALPALPPSQEQQPATLALTAAALLTETGAPASTGRLAANSSGRSQTVPTRNTRKESHDP